MYLIEWIKIELDSWIFSFKKVVIELLPDILFNVECWMNWIEWIELIEIGFEDLWRAVAVTSAAVSIPAADIPARMDWSAIRTWSRSGIPNVRLKPSLA